MENLLEMFKQFQINRQTLCDGFGKEKLYNIHTKERCHVSPVDVVNAIHKYQNGEISMDILLDWVNTLWFTDVFDYDEKYSDSIASVMDLLEELDEDGVFYTDDEYDRMIAALESNMEFSRD